MKEVVGVEVVVEVVVEVEEVVVVEVWWREREHAPRRRDEGHLRLVVGVLGLLLHPLVRVVDVGPQLELGVEVEERGGALQREEWVVRRRWRWWRWWCWWRWQPVTCSANAWTQPHGIDLYSICEPVSPLTSITTSRFVVKRIVSRAALNAISTVSLPCSSPTSSWNIRSASSASICRLSPVNHSMMVPSVDSAVPSPFASADGGASSWPRMRSVRYL